MINRQADRMFTATVWISCIAVVLILLVLYSYMIDSTEFISVRGGKFVILGSLGSAVGSVLLYFYYEFFSPASRVGNDGRI